MTTQSQNPRRLHVDKDVRKVDKPVSMTHSAAMQDVLAARMVIAQQERAADLRTKLANAVACKSEFLWQRPPSGRTLEKILGFRCRGRNNSTKALIESIRFAAGGNSNAVVIIREDDVDDVEETAA